MVICNYRSIQSCASISISKLKHRTYCQIFYRGIQSSEGNYQTFQENFGRTGVILFKTKHWANKLNNFKVLKKKKKTYHNSKQILKIWQLPQLIHLSAHPCAAMPLYSKILL